MRQIPLACLALLAVALPALAQSPTATVTVTGRAEIEVAPDLALLEVGGTLRGAEPEETLEAMRTLTGDLLAALSGAGVAPSDIQTRQASLRPVFARGDGASEPVPVHYEAQGLLTVTVRDLADLGEIYALASDAGATRLDGLRFTLSDPAGAEAVARRAAVADARLRAETYAAAAGMALGAVVFIAEPESAGGPMPVRAAAMDAAPMPVAPGTVSVSAQVTVVYALTD